MRHLRELSNSTLIFNCICLLGLLLMLGDTQGQKTDRTSLLSRKIYERILGIYPCFRRMNGTHQIGCSTASNGDVGVLHLIDYRNETFDLDWVLNKGPHPPYVVLLYLPSFKNDLLRKLNNPARVNGILLIEEQENTSRVESFSTDSQCPNEGYGLYNKSDTRTCEKWNPPGSSLLFDDWAFTIIYIEGKDEAKTLLDCYNTFNKPNSDGTAREWPLCATQLKAHMIAAVDSPTCVRRNEMSASAWNMSPKSVCDPVGGVNIYAPLVSRSQAEPYPTSPNGSVIVIATRLDASSMFDKFTPGADTSATGLSALLALVKYLQPLKKLLPSKETGVENVYFIIFNGEAFDYIGSSRIVYDMAKNKFPTDDKDNSSNHAALLRMKDIRYFIELEQLAQYDSNTEYFIHRNWDAPSIKARNDTLLQNLIDVLEEQSKLLNLKMTPIPNRQNWKGLPPASLQSFLAKNPDLPGVVITNHGDEKFRNLYYNSILDDDNNIGLNESSPGSTVNAMAKLVEVIGKTVEQLILPKSQTLNGSDPESVNDILECYVKTANCSLFQKVWKVHSQLTEKPFPLYSGVYGKYGHYTPASSMTTKVMTYFSGEEVDKNEDDCKHDNDKPIFDYVWLNDSCYKTSVSVTSAQSPAFDIDDYDWNSREYSTWTESSWNHFSVKIFLKPSFGHDLFTLLFGLVVFIISSVIIYWINEKSDLIFESRGEQIC